MLDWKIRKKVFINRQPTLWRHGIPFVDIVPLEDKDDETIRLNPLFLEPLNADFDGDTLALYVIHDQKALEEANNNAFLGKDVYYDHSESFLSLIRHEALYAVYILTKDFNNIDELFSIDLENLSDLEEDIEKYNQPFTCVNFKGVKYTYGICLLNKWCGFTDVKINSMINKRNNSFLSEMIWQNSDGDVKKYYRQLNHLEKNLFFYISINDYFPPTINLNEMIRMSIQVEDLIAKVPNNIEIGYLINEALIKKCLLEFSEEETTLFDLFKSGSRFSEKQLARSCINIGFIADSENQIHPTAFNTNLLKGLTERQFFESSSGTRKGISDKSKSTPSSGYLERSLAMGLSIVELAEEDCGTKTCLELTIINEKHKQTLIDKWYKNKKSDPDWMLITEETPLKIEQQIFVRSPIFCQTPNMKICQKCFGQKDIVTNYIGILAGQILAERFTQLSLRSFHDSGSANLETDKELMEFIRDHLTDIISDESEVILEFDTNNIPVKFNSLIDYKNTKQNKLFFAINKSFKLNSDPVEGLKHIREIIKATKNIKYTPSGYYQELMKAILDVGSPYSSFVEILFANMFLCIDGTIWRYNQSEKIVKKLGDKTLAGQISPLLDLLYQQNSKSTESIDSLDSYLKDDVNLTIYEKLFLEKF
jgi:DNA-directed RNA polymerase subunit beta-beta'